MQQKATTQGWVFHLFSRLQVGSSDQQVGKSLAVVVVVVVEQELWRLSQSVGLGYDLVAGVEGVLDSWDLVAEKN